ncbi:MAG: hypothetical protein JWM56_961 [Candidatus Peribacteria bacterium]|nr:hypothetical protein [Candidatus Peribacteria bacterium]
MMSILLRTEQFFFRRVDARGFGIMRIAWALATFFSMLWRLPDVLRFYSNAGMLPVSLEPYVMHTMYRFSLLDTITGPTGVLALYALLLTSLACAAIGYRTRASVILSVVLLFSFHERNTILLSGGDTVLRFTGFFLLLCPVITAFSLDRLRNQWHTWNRHHHLLPPPTMPVWPVLLLTWQLVILYFTSFWDKMQGSAWPHGTAVASILHQAYFVYWPRFIMDMGAFASPAMDYATLAYEFSWLLLIIPAALHKDLPWKHKDRVRRLILCGGILFHGSIFLLMDVGSFTPALLAAYCGLLTKEDFDLVRRRLNRQTKPGSITVLYDGRCKLCRRSMFGLQILDWLHRLHAVDFHKKAAHAEVAPDVQRADLDLALHIRFANGHTEKGFYAFRALAWHLPLLWIKAPFLYLPGVSFIGERVYAGIARRRERCSHIHCD